MATGQDRLRVELRDSFWAPRQAQLREHTLPVLLERLEEHGVVDNFRRLSGQSTSDHQGLWFTDSDLYKWMEAAAWAGRLDLLDPIIEAVLAAQQTDGYLHSFYGTETSAGAQPRFGDLGTSHEMYCAGHFIEAALAHESRSSSSVMLDAAVRVADHLCATFGPGDSLDPRVDKHPEIELAMARLASATGRDRYLGFAHWAIERQLEDAGLSLETLDLAGHAVKALYFASGIAEVALATGSERWSTTAARLFDTMVTQHSYPTGAVGGRWLGEQVGQPYELPSAMAYAESCAGVASVQFCDRIWRLTHDLRALHQIETLLYNAVPAGVGSDGDTWFYSQPHAVGPEALEENPWVDSFDYGQLMLMDWFPPRRHAWFDVTCCPPNLARMFATVDRYVADLDGDDLLVHIPVACRITGGAWDLEVSSLFPASGSLNVKVTGSPRTGSVRVRRPTWADRGQGDDGGGHVPVASGEGLDLSFEPKWWETDQRVEAAAGTVFLRCGPLVHCVEGIDVPGVDLRSLRVDPSAPPGLGFELENNPSGADLYRLAVADPSTGHSSPISVPTVPYCSWANRGPTTMRMQFRRR